MYVYPSHYIIQLYHSNLQILVKKNDRAFVLLPQKILNKLSLNSIDIHCKSLIEIYKTQNESLNNISLAKFVANFDTKSSKKCKCNKIKHWVSFNLHKDSKVLILLETCFLQLFII
jgi:hypothetical protein